MKRLAKWVGILVSVLFLSGSAWGYDALDHIKVAPNGKGDLMWFKYYVAAPNGWETKISVTNTAAVSVVAKVVIRSYKNSTELLDFMIYLSPYDVWTAKIYWDGSATKIYSEDSSCRNQNGNWASAAEPLDYALKTIGTSNMPFCADDSTTMGYIYVVQSAWSNAPLDAVKGSPNFAAAGVSKADIKKWFENKAGGPFVTWPVNATFLNTGTWNNSLAGYQLFFNRLLGMWSSAVQATVLRDYKSTKYLDLAATDRLGSLVSNNSLGEIEAAIAKTEIDLPYVSASDKATVHIFSAVTKYTTGSDCTVSKFTYEGPWYDIYTHADGRVIVSGVEIWDVDEHKTTSEHFSPSPTSGWRNEVEIFAVPHDWPEGHVRYPFSGVPVVAADGVLADNGTSLVTYAGIPILSTVVFFGDYDSYSIEGAWSNAAVTVGGIALPFYQYADGITAVIP